MNSPSPQWAELHARCKALIEQLQSHRGFKAFQMADKIGEAGQRIAEALNLPCFWQMVEQIKAEPAGKYQYRTIRTLFRTSNPWGNVTGEIGGMNLRETWLREESQRLEVKPDIGEVWISEGYDMGLENLSEAARMRALEDMRLWLSYLENSSASSHSQIVLPGDRPVINEKQRQLYARLCNCKKNTLLSKALHAGEDPPDENLLEAVKLNTDDAKSGDFIDVATYQYWLKRESWTIEEAACLARGYPPFVCEFIDIARETIPLSLSPICATPIWGTFDLVKRAVGADTLKSRSANGKEYVSPREFLAWYCNPRPGVLNSLPDTLDEAMRHLSWPDPYDRVNIGQKSRRKDGNANSDGTDSKEINVHSDRRADSASDTRLDYSIRDDGSLSIKTTTHGHIDGKVEFLAGRKNTKLMLLLCGKRKQGKSVTVREMLSELYTEKEIRNEPVKVLSALNALVSDTRKKLGKAGIAPEIISRTGINTRIANAAAEMMKTVSLCVAQIETPSSEVKQKKGQVSYNDGFQEGIRNSDLSSGCPVEE